MFMKIKFLIFVCTHLFFATISIYCRAQTESAAELQRILDTAQNPIQKEDARMKLSAKTKYSDPNKSKDLAEQAVINCRELNDVRLLTRAYLTCGTILGIMGEYEEATQSNDSAWVYCQMVSNDSIRNELYGRISSNQGWVQNALGDNSAAISSYFEALKYFELAESKRGVAVCQLHLANLYELIGMSEQSLEYLFKAYHLSIEFNYRVLEGAATANIGLAFRNSGELDSAEYYFNAGLVIEIELGNDGNIGVGYSNLAEILMKKGNLERAIELSKVAIEYKRKFGVTNSLIMTHSNLSNYYMQIGEFNNSLAHLDTSFVYADSISSLEEKMFAYRQRAELHSEMGNAGKAFEDLLKYTVIKDSLFDTQRESIMAAYKKHEKYEFESEKLKLENRNLKLSEGAKIDQERIDKRNWTLAVVFLVLIATLVVVSVQRRGRILLRKEKRETESKNLKLSEQNKKLDEQKISITEQNQLLEQKQQELDALYQDMSHRISNWITNLLAVKSVFNDGSDQSAQAILDHLMSRIETMKELHLALKIGGRDNMSSVNEMLTTLAANMKQASVERNWSVQISAPDITLSPETSLYLMSFAHELVLNSLKHARHERNSSDIGIKVEADGSALRLEVFDNGLEASGGNSTGSGIGVTLMRKMVVEILGGQFEIERKSEMYKTTIKFRYA
jgi:two-component sensor histidine kinase